VVNRRIAQLSAPAREVLGRAASIGREFGCDALLRTVALPGTCVGNCVREALRLRVLIQVPGRPRAYRFAHTLIHEILRDGAAVGSSMTVPACAGTGFTSEAVTEATFRLEGEYWTIAFHGPVLRLRDTKSLHYVAYLLRYPGQALRALDVVAAAYGTAPRTAGECTIFDAALEQRADRKALADYRRRLEELPQEIDEARAFNDLGRIEVLQAEAEWLAQQVKVCCGLGGRVRVIPSPAERARQAVTKGVRNVEIRLRANLPGLARHLERHIKTGYLCSYDPDPSHAIAWQF
jgi:hypothetical protein